jgi:hypothetical protein
VKLAMETKKNHQMAVTVGVGGLERDRAAK